MQAVPTAVRQIMTRPKSHKPISRPRPQEGAVFVILKEKDDGKTNTQKRQLGYGTRTHDKRPHGGGGVPRVAAAGDIQASEAHYEQHSFTRTSLQIVRFFDRFRGL